MSASDYVEERRKIDLEKLKKSTEELHSMGNGRLQMMLSQKKLDPRTLIAAIRTAAELDGKIGARAELNINTQQNFFGTPPPQAALIMARRFKEILAERIASGETMKGSDEEISFLKEI